MRTWIAVGLAALALCGCATAPQTVVDGSMSQIRGKTVSLLEDSGATGLDAAADRAVMDRFATLGATVAAPGKGDYLVQVSFTTLPAGVNVSRSGAGTPLEQGWSAPPPERRLWSSRPKARLTLTFIGLDASTGTVAFRAAATGPAGKTPEEELRRLVDAAFSPPPM